MKLQRAPPITLSKKKRRRLRSRYQSSREAKDEPWQNWSSDSANSTTDAELSSSQIAVMSNEMEKILFEAGAQVNDAQPCEVETQSTLDPLPATVVAPSNESKVKQISVRAVPTSEKPPNNDGPLTSRSPFREKPQRSAQGLYRAPPERLESLQATVLREELDPTLPCKQSSDTDAPMQQEPCTSGFAGASSEPSRGRLRARKKEPRESPAYRYYVPPPLAAPAVPSTVYHSNVPTSPVATTFPAPTVAGSCFFLWYPAEFRPTSPVVQNAGLVCDECKFTCTSCGRRSPDVKFTMYCAECRRPVHSLNETSLTCKNGNTHRPHDQEDDYCNCKRVEAPQKCPSSGSLKKVDGAVPFLYSTRQRTNVSRRAPQKQSTGGIPPSTRQVWTTSNTTIPDGWESDHSDVTDSLESRPSRKSPSAHIADTAEDQPLYVTADAHASFNWPPPLPQASPDRGAPHWCPTCGCPGQPSPCVHNGSCVCLPQPNSCCCCFDVPYNAAITPRHQAPLTWAAEVCTPQPTDFCRDHSPMSLQNLPLPHVCPSVIRSEETWTDGSTVRRIVVEETGPPGSLRASVSRTSATVPSTSTLIYPSAPSAILPSVTCSTSSWGRTLDFNPLVLSRRYSYVTCVPENTAREGTWSSTLLGDALNLPITDRHEKSWPTAPETASRKSSLRGSERRRYSSSNSYSRKASLAEPLNSPIPSSNKDVRKSSVEEQGQRSPFVFSVGRRKSSIKANAIRRSSTASAPSRNTDVQETKRRPSLSSKSLKKPSLTDTEMPLSHESAPTSRKSSIRACPNDFSNVKSKSLFASGTQTERCRLSSICVGTEAPTRADVEVQATEKYVTRIPKDADADIDISNNAGSMLAFKTLKSLPPKESGVKYNENTVSTHHYKGISSTYVAHSDKEEPVTKRKESKPSVRSYDMASEHGEKEIANKREYVSYIKYDGERSATSYRDDSIGRDLPSKRYEPCNHQTTNKSTGNEDGAAAEDKPNGSERVAGTPRHKEDAEVERSQLSDGKHSAEDQQYDSGEAGEGANHSPLAESPAPPAKVSEYNEKMAEEPLNELLSSTMSLYPESRLVIALAMLGILWVIAIIVLSAAGHAHKLLFPGDPTHDFIAGTTESSYTVPYPTSTTEVTMPTTTTHPNTPGSKVYMCSTPFCEREGTYLKSLLSSENNPCDNFYDYVCDIWKANARPNVGLGFGTAVSRDTFIEEEMESEVVEYLRRGSQDVLLALQLFNACLRSTNLQGTEAKMALKDMFKDLIAATWPVAPTDTSFSSSHVWTLAGTLYRQFGIDAFLGVSIGRHQSNHPSVVLEPPRMLFLKHYEVYSMTVSMFQDAIREALTLSSNPDIAQEVANDVYTVLSDLAERQSAEEEFNFRIAKPDDLPKGLRMFLSAVFEGRFNTRAVVVRNPEFTFKQLENHVKSNDIPSLINYLGFRLVIRIAPFLPTSGFENLKMIFSAETTGRVRSLPLHQSYLCLRAVEVALPVCVVKAHAKVHMASGNDLNDRVWLSQVESSFFRNVAQLSWVDDLSYMIIRFKMANTKLARFFPGWSLDMGQCNGSIVDYGSGTVQVYRKLCMHAMRMKLGQINSHLAPRDPGSPFATRSRYSWSQQAVYVPLGIINSSVPSNATLFAFHLSRVAVRFFHGLVPLLRQEPTALGASYNLQYTNHSQTLFRNFLNCLSRDLSTVLRQTRAEFDLDPDDASYALLAQTVAVALTFITFRELLHVERVWKLSFRLSTLPDLSSDQLFFVWFALDNCENSDPTYQIRQYQWWKRLPPDFAVNFPLRHLPNSFGEAFNCPPGSFMRPSGYQETCNIFNTTANYHVLP